MNNNDIKLRQTPAFVRYCSDSLGPIHEGGSLFNQF